MNTDILLSSTNPTSKGRLDFVGVWKSVFQFQQHRMCLGRTKLP